MNDPITPCHANSTFQDVRGGFTMPSGWKSEDVFRLGAFLSAGVTPDKAEALVNLVRTVQTKGNPDEQAKKLLAIHAHLIAEGMPPYPVYLALLCHPSDHEPYLEIGSDYLAAKEVL